MVQNNDAAWINEEVPVKETLDALKQSSYHVCTHDPIICQHCNKQNGDFSWHYECVHCGCCSDTKEGIDRSHTEFCIIRRLKLV